MGLEIQKKDGSLCIILICRSTVRVVTPASLANSEMVTAGLLRTILRIFPDIFSDAFSDIIPSPVVGLRDFFFEFKRRRINRKNGANEAG